MEEQKQDAIFQSLMNVYGEDFHKQGLVHFRKLQKERELERRNNRAKHVEEPLSEFMMRYKQEKKMRKKLL